MEHYNELSTINVNDKVEKKNGLNYLSWAFAWAEVKKKYPEASYNVVKFEGKPYLYDETLGYMVFTNVTIEGITHEMWLPVLDGANKSMRAEDYTYMGKEKKWSNEEKKYIYVHVEKTCEKATMFDINKTIMRCLTKNLAMFGLGLYIYAGEDLPEAIAPEDEWQPMTLEQAKNHIVEVTEFAGMSLGDIYNDANARKKINEMYELGNAKTKQAITLAQAEIERKKKSKNEVPQ